MSTAGRGKHVFCRGGCGPVRADISGRGRRYPRPRAEISPSTGVDIPVQPAMPLSAKKERRSANMQKNHRFSVCLQKNHPYEPNFPCPHRAGPIPLSVADGRLGLLVSLGEEYSLGSHLHVVAGVPH